MAAERKKKIASKRPKALRGKMGEHFNPDGSMKPEFAITIRRLRFKGLTEEQVAQSIDIAESTLYVWKDRFPEFSEALKNGKDEANGLIENKLYNRAMDGNLTAIIFWLKNNYSEKYSDAQTTPEDAVLKAAQTRKISADAEISELKAKLLKNQGNSAAKKLDDLLGALDDGLTEIVEGDDKHEDESGQR